MRPARRKEAARSGQRWLRVTQCCLGTEGSWGSRRYQEGEPRANVIFLDISAVDDFETKHEKVTD
jgi:hypothetical protein